MSIFKSITLDTNNPTEDAFGRIRISQPDVIFDSKQTLNTQPLLL